MPVGVGASGFIGIAPEATANTYVAPTKFLLLRSESLSHADDDIWRRPLRGIADIHGATPGNVRVEGDISVELTSDQLVHILRGARGTITKTGGAAPYTYEFVPNHAATPAKTLSATVVRNGVSFGYVGLVVSSFSFTVDGGLLVGNFSMLGSSEATQSVPTPTYPTAVPYGMGEYNIEIPTATAVFDTDTFTFAVNDNAEPQYRLKGTGRGAQFIKYGERSVELDVERDFEARTEYDAYKALTASSVTIKATKGANDSITVLMPSAIKDTYGITGLSGQADLIRAGIKYMGVYDAATTQSYKITAISSENITIT